MVATRRSLAPGQNDFSQVLFRNGFLKNMNRSSFDRLINFYLVSFTWAYRVLINRIRER